MAKDVKIIKISLDEDGHHEVTLIKKLKDFEILETGKIKCRDWPSLCQGIQDYVAQHQQEWGIKEGETVGTRTKGKSGYDWSESSLKPVEFYRIRDNL